MAKKMRIGFVPAQAWRTANIPAHAQYAAIPVGNQRFDVTDFTVAQRAAIFQANAAYIATLGALPVKLARTVAKVNAVSDVSGNLLHRPTDYNMRLAEVDHVIPYQFWGTNHFRNARIVSKGENLGGGMPLPPRAQWQVIALEPINYAGRTYRARIAPGSNKRRDLHGPVLATGGVVSLADLNWMLDYARVLYQRIRNPTVDQRSPTHHENNPLMNPGDMTNDDFYAVCFTIGKST